MPATPDDLFCFLDRLGIGHPTVSHPPLFTVEQSQSLRGQIAGGHSKNLFLKDKSGRLFLLVLLEDARIDLKWLPRLIGAGRLSFGSAGLLREVLGVEPGSVTPFALINDKERRVTPVLDETMMAHEVLNYHPLVNTMTTSIRAADLLKFVCATGHSPLIRAVSAAPFR
jgi:Ala-tRNA(Pro) deacylase